MTTLTYCVLAQTITSTGSFTIRQGILRIRTIQGHSVKDIDEEALVATGIRQELHASDHKVLWHVSSDVDWQQIVLEGIIPAGHKSRDRTESYH